MQKSLTITLGLLFLGACSNVRIQAQAPQTLPNVSTIFWYGAPNCTWTVSGNTISTPCISTVTAGVSSVSLNGGSAQTGAVALTNIVRSTQQASAPSGACTDAAAQIINTATSPATLYGCLGGTWTLIGGSGGGSGILTSFQGRTTPAATLLLADVTGLGTLTNNTSGTAAIATAVPTGTPTANAQIAYNSSGPIYQGYLGGSLIDFVWSAGTITAGDCAQWSNNFHLIDSGAPCGSGGGSSFYQTIQNAGTPVTQRANLNLVGGTTNTIALTFLDNGTNTTTVQIDAQNVPTLSGSNSPSGYNDFTGATVIKPVVRGSTAPPCAVATDEGSAWLDTTTATANHFKICAEVGGVIAFQTIF